MNFTYIKELFKLIRVDHWIKNVLLFLPMFFNQELAQTENIALALIAFLSFSFITSSIYSINDIVDLEFDKKHIQKRNRPIASGIISKKTAITVAFLMGTLSLSTAIFFLNLKFIFIIITYFSLNIFYTFSLKKIILIDVLCISLSFILRIIAGGVFNNTRLTFWIIGLIFLLSLYLAITKRRDEVEIYKTTKAIVRTNIAEYSKMRIDIITKLLITSIILVYTAYTIFAKSMHNHSYAIYTTIFVLLGIARYEHLVAKRTYYANPTKTLLKDSILKMIIIAWFLSYYILIYK